MADKMDSFPESKKCVTQPSPEILRGLAYAIPASLAGFLLPYAVRSSILLMEWFTEGMTEFNMRWEIRNMRDGYAFAGMGCAILLGMSALLNFTLAVRMGYLRAVIKLGLCLIPGIVLTAVISRILESRPVLKGSKGMSMVELAVHGMLFFCFLFSFCVAYTGWKIRRAYATAAATSPKVD